MNKKSNNIIKKDLVENLYEKVGFPKKELIVIVNDIFELINYNLEKENKIKINSFGTFEVRHKKERLVFNPKTKEPNKIKARKVVSFVASKKLRQLLQDK